MTIHLTRRHVLIGVPAVILTATAASAWMLMSPPSDLDLSRSRKTDHGLYLATIAPEGAEPTVGPLNAWSLNLKSAAGAAVAHATIGVDGGMPQHGHGLPTAPVASAENVKGHYRIDGVRFSMSGWWVLKLAIDGPQGPDTVTFNLVL
jgi:hypothetical protein